MSAIRKAESEALYARARSVRHDGSYGGVFEMCVWCHMQKVTIVLAVGVTMINVLATFGKNLPSFTPQRTLKIVAGKFVKKTLMSADLPGGVTTPDVNHFVAARSKVHGKGLTKASGASAALLPDGSRRTAAAIADECEWYLESTNEDGDDLVDCFAYYQNKKRDGRSWKAIRNSIADEIDKIAKKAAESKADAWVECLMVCEENAIAKALVSSPINPDAAPEFNIQVCPEVLWGCDIMASSSSSSNVLLGHGENKALVAGALAVPEPATDATYCVVFSAGAASTAETNAYSALQGKKRRKLPDTFLASGNAASSSGSSGDKGASAGSSGDTGAPAGGKKQQAGPGINRKANVMAFVSRASKDDGSFNSDDALASRNGEDDLIPDVSAVWERAKTSVARAAVDGADCDAPKSFEKWVLSLPKPEQEDLTESYLHYVAAQEEWKRQMGWSF